MSDPTAPKVALVTGASRGIGHAIALALAARGFALFLAAEGTAEELAGAATACRASGAPDAVSAIFDLAAEGAAEAMVSAALARFGRLDVLVNNAGIRCRKPFGSFTRAEFRALLAVDLEAAFFASQAVLPAMRRQGGGRIIHIASQMGRVAAEENALYGAAKAALLQLTRNMAFELAKENIQVNSVSPGPIATQYNIESYGRMPGRTELMTSRVPAGRFGRPEEVAEAVAFLATCETGYIQGHDLLIDGGYTIH
ncbi:SDR family oxidoreductase [Siccirubricoccus sp. KC 17139]|uniref:SDR family oxidoreductase n=1 Tax=Siccirubricoccus soli TaxID=2899147 RepID=A0ABT1D491_9PROT|nr:SDR family oxidoreductase [Siccirubricoccus soli]MCO6416689.1 SDR family oxidoreductase [Siccirubricoccus soli]MCP2682824.1 SDR family oxidoreductase [Siccirubricoccus soli]